MAIFPDIKTNGEVARSIPITRHLLTRHQQSKITAYFEVVTRVLQHADRATVLSHLRVSFKILLEALDIVKVDEKVPINVYLNLRRFNSLFPGSIICHHGVQGTNC